MLEIKLTNVYGDPSASLHLQHSTLGRLGRSLVGKAVLSLALAVRRDRHQLEVLQALTWLRNLGCGIAAVRSSTS